MGELPRMAEIHGVRCALDYRDGQVRRRQATDLLYPPRWRHERVAGADHGQRGHRCPEDAFERGEPHELAEQLQSVHRAEAQVVGEHHAHHAWALAAHVARELHEGPGERLVMHPPAGAARTTPATRSRALCATSRLTGPPIELPTRTTCSGPSASRTSRSAQASDGIPKACPQAGL